MHLPLLSPKGLAIYNSHILEFQFPPVLYKKLMGAAAPPPPPLPPPLAEATAPLDSPGGGSLCEAAGGGPGSREAAGATTSGLGPAGEGAFDGGGELPSAPPRWQRGMGGDAAMSAAAPPAGRRGGVGAGAGLGGQGGGEAKDGGRAEGVEPLGLQVGSLADDETLSFSPCIRHLSRLFHSSR